MKYKHMIEMLGGKYVGIQEYSKDGVIPRHVLFNAPNGSTLALSEKEICLEKIREKLESNLNCKE